MNYKKTNNTATPRFSSLRSFFLLIALLSPIIFLSAQETKTASIALSFSQTDSTRTCTATVTSNGVLVAGPEVHLYVKRMYSLLPVGKVAAADEQGVVNFNFPMDLPGDKNGMLTVIARIEKDENYGNAETQAEVKWGISPTNESYDWFNRSLSASREKAPMLLVIASIVIIVIIWGTIFYIILQLVRIKKAARSVSAAGRAV